MLKKEKSMIDKIPPRHFFSIQKCPSRQILTRIILLIIFTSLCFYPLISRADSKNLKKVKLILLWEPQTQFAGYYVAKDKGFYKKYGLDVDFLDNESKASPAEFLKNGQADFAVMWLSSAIKKRSEGISLVNICQLVKRSALMLVMRKSTGIQKPEDLQGKKVSLWEGELRLQPEAFFRKFGLHVKIIPQSYTVNLFLSGGVDAVSAMWYNEYHTILNSGLNPDEVVTFFFSDYGLNFPEDGIYMLKENFKEDEATATAFVKATLEGWLYAFAHQNEAVEIVLKYMKEKHLPANRMHQKWMLARMKDLVAPKGNHLSGVLKKEDYELVESELISSGIIDKPIDFKEFYIPVNKND